MFKVIGKFSEDANGKEFENFDELRKELGLIGSLSDDVGKIDLFYDDNGNTYAVAQHAEFYYGTNKNTK